MSFRAVAALALLIVALGAERCGYYASRSVLMLDLRAAGMSGADALTLYRTFTFVAYVAAFAGGGLAFAIGPRMTAAIGAVIAAVGAFSLAGGAPASVASFVLALGAGVFKACPYAAAAEVLADEDGGVAQGFLPTPRRFASFATFAVLTYGAINVGAFIAPIVTGVLRTTRDGGGSGSSHAFGGAMDLLAAILAGISTFLGSGTAKTIAREAHAPYRGPDAMPALQPSPQPRTNDVFVPLTLLGVVFVAMHFVMDRAQPGTAELGMPNSSWLYSMNPIIVLAMTVPCGALFFVLALQRSPLPLTRILGAGIVLFGFGGMLSVIAMVAGAGVATWAAVLGVTAIAEAVAFPLGLTYAALAVRSRAATLVVAGWITLTAIPTYLFGTLGFGERMPIASTIFVALGTLVVLVGGVLVLVNAARLHRDLAGHSNATS